MDKREIIKTLDNMLTWGHWRDDKEISGAVVEACKIIRDSMLLDILNEPFSKRNVGNYKTDEFIIDTSKIWDSENSFESAIQHKDFNNNQWIILSRSKTETDAKTSHDKWVDYFKNNTIDEIYDISENIIYKRENNETV